MSVWVCVHVYCTHAYPCAEVGRRHLIVSFYSAHFFTSGVSLSLGLSLFWTRLEVSKPLLCFHLPLKLGYAKLQTWKDSWLVALDLWSKLPIMIAQQMLLIAEPFLQPPPLIFDNDVKNRYWRKDNFFYNWVWEVWIATYGRIKLDLYSSLCIKSIQDGLKTEFNTETLQLLEGNTSKHFHIGGTFQ